MQKKLCMLLRFMPFGGASGTRLLGLLVPLQIANSWQMNNLLAVGWFSLHSEPDIWSYEHLKYREKSARKCSI